MAKYYVISGKVKTIISEKSINDPREAAKEAMLRHLQTGVKVAPLIIVNEIGFDLSNHMQDADYIYDTEEILEEAGFFEAEPDEDN